MTNETQDWARSEALCLEFAQRAVDWLNDFYAASSGTFRVAYSSGDHESDVEAPNASTSLIGIVVEELAPFWDILIKREQLEQHVADSRRSAVAASLSEVLPLRSFGVLPPFSTSRLALYLAAGQAPLTQAAYAIAIRRVLFSMFQQMSSVGATRRKDQLHPYVLHLCARALSRMVGVLRTARALGNTDDIATFVANLRNDDLLTTVVVDPTVRASVYGTGTDIAAFRTAYLDALLTATGEPGPAVEGLLHFAEDTAIRHVVTEIATSSRTAESKCDPSSLVFSMAILAERSVTRHAALIAQGSQVAIKSIRDGMFPSAWPFHIDSQGRAVFVPSVEIANALLTVTLTRGDSVPIGEVHSLIAGTRGVEARLVEDYLEVDVMSSSGATKLKSGWCSDRAPSRTRVDSWVTVHALEFFLRRLRLIRSAKRADVLTRYSWVSSGRCRPKWEDIVDPDGGLEARGVKDRILAEVEADVATRDRAPMFLLYGPPGTSKTSLVQGLSNLKGWDLVTLSPSDFVADSLDRIEQRARIIFQDLLNLDRCVVLMDEMDSLLRDRELLNLRAAGSIIEFVVPALLPKLQELRDHVLRRNMAVFFVSNYYEGIDRAIIRGGRIDNHILVLPYCRQAQREVLRRLLERRGRGDLLDELSAELTKLSCRFVYRDLEQFVALACSAAGEPYLASALSNGSAYGIQPEVYRVTQRKGAFREVCAFSARLRNVTYASALTFSQEDAQRALIAARKDLPDWGDFLGTWADDLEGSRGGVPGK